MSFEVWVTFVTVCLITAITPGPNAAYAMATGMANRFPKAFFGPLGIGIAVMVQALIASLGLGTVLLASADLFNVIKWLGVIYFIWLGIQHWHSTFSLRSHKSRISRSSVQLLIRGCLVALFNPKAVLFFVAIFPQFMSQESALAPQLLGLMATASAVAILVYSTYAALAVRLAEWMTKAGHGSLLNRIIGSIFIVGAMGLALIQRR